MGEGDELESAGVNSDGGEVAIAVHPYYEQFLSRYRYFPQSTPATAIADRRCAFI